jgi:ATP-dependent 26S proteasome regulatory subunit
MLKKYLNDSAGEDTLQEIASATEDFSMAYLKELYIYSAMIALKKGNEVPSKSDLLQALETLKYQLKNGCKPFDKIGSQKVGFSMNR